MRIVSMLIGFVLDMIIGDPQNAPHPVRYIGSLIEILDKKLNIATDTKGLSRTKGVLTLVVVWLCTSICVLLIKAVPILILALLHYQGIVYNARLAAWIITCLIDGILFYYGIAAKDLYVEAMEVGKALEHEEDLDLARKKLSYIVGRDTASLDKEAVIRASIETVAENTGDGVVGPILAFALFGSLGLWIFKATSTMDSMIGYKNEKYRYFGTAGARMDDLFNFIPARLTAWLIILVAFVWKQVPLRQSVALYNKDKGKSPSPNSGHPEASMAAVLGVKLLGPCYYKGILHDKPFVGIERETVELRHIKLSCSYMYIVALLTVILGVLINVYFI